MTSTFKYMSALTTAICLLGSYNISNAAEITVQDITVQEATSPKTSNIVKTAALTQTIPAHSALKSKPLPLVKTASVNPTTAKSVINPNAFRLTNWSANRTQKRPLLISSLSSDKLIADKKWTAAPLAYNQDRRTQQQNADKYTGQFNGLRPDILADNDGKIGSVSAFSQIDDRLKFNYQSASNSQFKNDAKNVFVRAQLNF